MTEYRFFPGDYSLDRMRVGVATLGGTAALITPINPETGLPGVTDLVVNVPDGTTEAQILDAYANARKPRPLYAIYADLQALSGPNKTAIWSDLSSGTPKKYLVGVGGNVAAIAALDWAASDSGATGNALTAARLRIAAMYCQDVPGYLVNPPFGTGINVTGDEPA